MLKGYKTLLLNGGIAAAAGFLQFVVGVDLKEYLNPTLAVVVLAVANFLLRLVTTTPVGVSAPKG